MTKTKKSMLKVYSVLAIGVALMLVAGFSLAVNAQADKEPSMLDQIIAAYLGLKANEVNTPTLQPVVEEPSIGYSSRPGDVILSKIVDYDDISTGGLQLFATTTGGFYLDNLIIEMGKNTLASGTLFQVYTKGEEFGASTTIFSAAVMSMTKLLSFDLNTPIGTTAGEASTTQRIVLEDNSAIFVKCTTLACKLSQIETELDTADENMRITAILKRTDTTSSIYE